MAKHQRESVRSGTYRRFTYKELRPNPMNPRRLFDKEPLKVLEESIRANGILKCFSRQNLRHPQVFFDHFDDAAAGQLCQRVTPGIHRGNRGVAREPGAGWCGDQAVGSQSSSAAASRTRGGI